MSGSAPQTSETDVQPGMRWRDKLGQVKVMAVADGYAMCRRPGCVPYVISLAEVRRQAREAS